MVQILTLHKGYCDRKIGVKLHFNKTADHNAIRNVKNNRTFSDIGINLAS